MEHNAEYYKDLLKLIKIPKFRIKIPEINKPPRWIVIAIAILLEFAMFFFILWLFDERTVFDNDYIVKRYGDNELKWGWVHMGTAVTSVVAAIVWFFVIVGGEFMAFKESERVFYNLYR